MAHIEIFVKNKGQSIWEFIGEASHALRYSYKLWVEMEKKYLPSPEQHSHVYMSRLVCGDDNSRQEIWDLWKRSDVPDDEKDVLLSTMDRAMVEVDRIPQFISHLKSVGQRYDTDHAIQAAIIESYYNNHKDEMLAVAVNQTSVRDRHCIFGEDMDEPLESFMSWSL